MRGNIEKKGGVDQGGEAENTIFELQKGKTQEGGRRRRQNER